MIIETQTNGRGVAIVDNNYPYHPCMVYLPTFTINQPNVGKYTIHGWYG